LGIINSLGSAPSSSGTTTIRRARLEQLGDAGQTAGDVTGFRGLARNAGQHVAGSDMGAVFDREDRVDGHEVAGLQTIGQRDHLVVFVAQGDARLEVRAPRLLFPIDHHPVGNAGGLVHHLAHGHALDQVDVVGDTLPLGDDRQGIGVPFGQLLALDDLGPLVG
jgi:hypothetical protein